MAADLNSQNFKFGAINSKTKSFLKSNRYFSVVWYISEGMKKGKKSQLLLKQSLEQCFGLILITNFWSSFESMVFN